MASSAFLQQDIAYLKGIGPARAKVLLSELGIRTVRDLLYTFPYKYVDRTVVHTVSQVHEGMPYVQLKGKIIGYELEGQGRKQRLKATFFDGTGYVEFVWFNGVKYVEKSYKVGREYVVLGKPTFWNGHISFAHPELELAENFKPEVHTFRPFYRTTERMKRARLDSRQLTEAIAQAFKGLAESEPEETLPSYIAEKYNLAPLSTSLRHMHFPRQTEELAMAERRMKFEELFFLQLAILRYAKNRKLKYRGFVFARVGNCFMQFYREKLPFELTEAQKRVVHEIRADLGSGRQMNRLLHGDVGSGKTMVALMACLLAVDNGFQACLMAPTEILAEQHFSTLRQMTEGLPLRVELLTGSVKGIRRDEVLRGVADGSVGLLVGTHAVIEPTVNFLNLGLVVIDEQHRFGVEQRAKLWSKNVHPPHVLVMTATPIPRTLAMTVYGDLDVSVIDQLPAGRKPIRTLHYYSNNCATLYAGMRRELAQGRQAYVVYPLIEESEKSDLKNLEDGFAAMTELFPEYRVGKLHGKMKPQEKEEAMQAFLRRETQILVSTTVIEVGVNVPNATVMVIEDAERFGLAQLHQLRGRVGRGGNQSYCVLVTGYKLSETTRRRIGIMVETTDGFRIAEEDLKLRGPGDLEGTQQSGLPFDLKVANVVRDAEMMSVAREAAETVLQADPYENLPQHHMVWSTLRQMKDRNVNFSAIS